MSSTRHAAVRRRRPLVLETSLGQSQLNASKSTADVKRAGAVTCQT